MIRSRSAILSLALLLVEALASADESKTKPSPKQAADDTILTGPLSDLSAALTKANRSKRAARLKRAWDALEAKNFPAGKRAAAPLFDDADFGDYARWVSAQADLRSAEAQLEKDRFQPAAAAARSAQVALSPITMRFPYSPWIKRVPSALAQADAIIARGACEAKKWEPCKSQYENALERWMSSNEMSYADPDSLDAYANACATKATPLCRAWILRLLQYYPSATTEFKAIAQHFPEYGDGVPKAESAGRVSQNYHAPDPDQVAIDAAISIYLDGKDPVHRTDSDSKYKDAIEAFQKFLDEFPRSTAKYRARYWLAQALKKIGKTEESTKLLKELFVTSPLTYYGLLASLELKQPAEGALSQEIPEGADGDEFLNPDEIVHLKRAKNFLAEKAPALAATELHEIRARAGLSSPFIVYLAMLDGQARNYSSAFAALTELFARGEKAVLSDYFIDVIFPTDDYALIDKVSGSVNLDPVLMTSLIKQESAFNPEALSSSGAIGMMQLMPLTAAETSDGLIRRTLFDKEMNIEVGTQYFDELSSRFLGNWVYAIGGYNAGPTAMSRWIKAAPPKRTMLEFIESIPYKETREYICSIIRNYFWYTKRVSPDAETPSLDLFWVNPGLQPSIEPAPTFGPDVPPSIATPTPTPSPSPIISPSSLTH